MLYVSAYMICWKKGLVITCSSCNLEKNNNNKKQFIFNFFITVELESLLLFYIYIFSDSYLIALVAVCLWKVWLNFAVD